MLHIDPVSILTIDDPYHPKLSPENYAKLRELGKRFAEKYEIFLCESPVNKYVPAPPEGYQAFRSSRRRVFVPLSADLSKSSPGELVAAGIATEHPLTCASSHSPNSSSYHPTPFSPSSSEAPSES